MQGYELEVLAGLGIFFGCFARTLIPFLKKRKAEIEAGKQFKWQHLYTITFILDGFIALITTMTLLPMFQIPTEFIFPVALIFGWGSQDLLNKIAK
jgi:hypothetical protein